MSLSYLDLEEAILAADQVSDDLQLLADHIANADEFDKDAVQNTLLGITGLQRLRHARLFDVFEQLVKACKLR